MTPAEQKRAAKQFVARWKSLPCVEEEHSRSFWIELLQDVLGVQNATHLLEFERKVDELKRKKRQLRNELEDQEDQISEQRREMIDELERRMIQSTESSHVFLIRWRVQ